MGWVGTLTSGFVQPDNHSTQTEDLIKAMTSDLLVVSSEEELHQLKVRIKDEIIVYVA
jgi:hypothetical protein